MEPVMLACEIQVEALIEIVPDRLLPACVQMIVNVPVAVSGEVVCQVPSHVPLRLSAAGVFDATDATVGVVEPVAGVALEAPHAPSARTSVAGTRKRNSERMRSSSSGLQVLKLDSSSPIPTSRSASSPDRHGGRRAAISAAGQS